MTSPQFQRKARQHHGGLMTPAQWWAIAQVTRSREPVRSAIRSVLVDGMTPTEAAAQAGIDRQSLYNAQTRYLTAHRLLAEAYSPAKATPRARATQASTGRGEAL